MLPIFDSIRDINFLSILIRMLIATSCGAIIGIERSIKNRSAGFRTHILVCIGAATASLTGHYLYLVAHLPTDMTRIGAQVITGLGFIGAGTIIVTRKQTVKGLTTAAGLWATGIIGLAVGSGFYEGAIVGTILVLIAECFFANVGQRIRYTPEFRAIISYQSKQSLDHALRFLKDRGMAITALQVSSENDDGVYVYSALVRLRPSSNLNPELIMERVSDISGILAAHVLSAEKKQRG
ncbi:MAG: MgtC/SapB family protein [Eubacteriales bacterium]|nr:MgtC/SapB family protein [Eubacteriales bacterium]